MKRFAETLYFICCTIVALPTVAAMFGFALPGFYADSITLAHDVIVTIVLFVGSKGYMEGKYNNGIMLSFVVAYLVVASPHLYLTYALGSYLLFGLLLTAVMIVTSLSYLIYVLYGHKGV